MERELPEKNPKFQLLVLKKDENTIVFHLFVLCTPIQFFNWRVINRMVIFFPLIFFLMWAVFITDYRSPKPLSALQQTLSCRFFPQKNCSDKLRSSENRNKVLVKRF